MLRPTGNASNAPAHPIIGDVIGFALRWDGQQHGVLWISGDTVLYDGVRQVADRVQADTALLHLGGVRFSVTGPARYTVTAQDAVESLQPHSTAYRHPHPLRRLEHFQEGRDVIEREFANAHEDVRRRIRWIPLGAARIYASTRPPVAVGVIR